MAHAEIVRLCGLAGVPVGSGPIPLARGLGLGLDALELPPQARGAIRRGEPVIYLNHSLRPQWLHRVIAHELFEHTLSERLPPDLHERYCDAGADLICRPYSVRVNVPVDTSLHVTDAPLG